MDDNVKQPGRWKVIGGTACVCLASALRRIMQMLSHTVWSGSIKERLESTAPVNDMYTTTDHMLLAGCELLSIVGGVLIVMGIVEIIRGRTSAHDNNNQEETKENDMRMKSIIVLLAAALCLGCLAGCGPYKRELAEEVESHETAFVIPLEVGTQENQEKLMSEEYLEHRKVAAKRIILGQRMRSTGRLWFDYEWIPTERVIKVDRKLVTKNWVTVKDKSGRVLRDNGFPLASQDSVGFTIGINLTLMIEEKEAARYLFFFREKSLDETAEEVVKGFVQNALSDEIGKLKLTDCQLQKVEIMERVKVRVKDELKEYGITLVTIGLADEFQYDNEEVQNAIDMVYVNESKIRQAEQAQKEATIVNQTALEKAQNEQAIKLKEAENENDIAMKRAQNDEQIAKIYEAIAEIESKRAEIKCRLMESEALVEASKKWNGQTPANVLPQGASMIYPFGVDNKK